MKRPYITGEKTNVLFFTGIEVEHTPQHGALTLFVVGPYPGEDIVDIALKHNCTNVYLGANQSFDGNNLDKWENMVRHILDNSKLWVTLDFDSHYSSDIHDLGFCEYRRFIPVISVKLPNINLFNYNTVLKIDDRDFNATNPGVWCHSLHKILDNDVFTDWDYYTNDKPI
jgi:hypothetical protein